jgi:hypothetical protein
MTWAQFKPRFKTEVISNISLRYEAAGNFPVITGNCLQSRTNFGASYGGDVKFLGFTLPLLEETQLFGKLGKLSQEGDACEWDGMRHRRRGRSPRFAGSAAPTSGWRRWPCD